MANINFDDRSSILGKGGRPIPSSRVDLVKEGSGFKRALGQPAGNLIDLDPGKDWRVRITLPPGSKFAWRDGKRNGLMYDLGGGDFAVAGYGNDGVVFPYIPTLTVTHNARYSEVALTHSNFKNYFYEGSDVGAITISGIFTCQNEDEAKYLMASIQFLRACTKMRFGQDDLNAGQPPTLVRLQGYGDDYLAGSLSCVVTQVSHVMPDDVDYVKYQVTDRIGWMPTSSTLSVTLQPVVSRKTQARAMNLDDFVGGKLVIGQTVVDTGRGGII
jgi:hypothetical protein